MGVALSVLRQNLIPVALRAIVGSRAQPSAASELQLRGAHPQLIGPHQLIGAAAMAALAVVGLIGACEIIGKAPTIPLSMPEISAILGAAAAALVLVGVWRWRRRARDAERALSHMRDVNRQVLERISDLFTYHDAKGVCTDAGGAAAPLLGVHAGELLGYGLLERVHLADQPAYLRTITEVAARRTPLSVLIRLRQKTSSRENRMGSGRWEWQEPRYLWADLRAYPVTTEKADEGCAEVVAVFRDVSAQKAREEELEAARAAAEEADRSKSRFLATVSHELRTPLNAVIGFSQMLANPELCPKDPGRLREYARIINDSGVHLLDLVNSFLDASRIENGRFELSVETFDLAELVKSACAIADVKGADSGVHLATITPAEGLPFEGDKRACRQIVINLVSNAVKFTPKGGRVKVKLRRVGSLIELAVDDTGIGIAAADLAKLGDPFFQAKSSYDRPYEGTGLGLSVVRGLVGLHGGSLQIESTPGAGTCVSVCLPVERPAVVPSHLSIARIDARPRVAPAQAVA